jgi:hypothetical protein
MAAAYLVRLKVRLEQVKMAAFLAALPLPRKMRATTNKAIAHYLWFSKMTGSHGITSAIAKP